MKRTDQLEKIKLKNRQLAKENKNLRRTVAELNRKISRWGRPTNEERLARVEEMLGLQNQLPIVSTTEIAQEKAKLIAKICAKAGGYTVEQLWSRFRTDALWLVRAHCWLLQLELLDLRDYQIGEMCQRERSTIYVAIKSVRNRIESEPKLKIRLDSVTEQVKAALKDFDGNRA